MNITRRNFLESTLALPTAVALARLSPRASTLPIQTADTMKGSSAKPNIIVIVTDDQDAPSLAVMRRLLAYPGGGWTNFSNAICADGICAPSRGTLLTGQYSHHHGVRRQGDWKHLDTAHALPVWLKSAGYTTALLGKYLWGGRIPPLPVPGWDTFTGRGGYADGVFGDGVDFIRRAAAPFFLWLAPVDPHIKARPPLRYQSAAVFPPPLPPNINEADVSDKPAWLQRRRPLDDGKLKALAKERVNAYRALLAVDDGVQALVDALAAKGQLDNTAIIYLSDNGFSWGSHRLQRKHNPYEEVIRLPLLIRLPGATANRIEPRVVSTVDLAATIADLAGVDPQLPQDGRSLLTLLRDPSIDWDEAALTEKFADPLIPEAFTALRTAAYSYIEWDDGDRELYDLTIDPYQLSNSAGRPEYHAVQGHLAARLAELRN